VRLAVIKALPSGALAGAGLQADDRRRLPNCRDLLETFLNNIKYPVDLSEPLADQPSDTEADKQKALLLEEQQGF
jgi:hypothetical protein